MLNSAELLGAYRDQAGLEADDAVEIVVDFLSSYGMAEGALAVLCDHVDDEGMTEDLARQLKEGGLVVEPGAGNLTDDETE